LLVAYYLLTVGLGTDATLLFANAPDGPDAVTFVTLAVLMLIQAIIMVLARPSCLRTPGSVKTPSNPLE
jgi:hypothetical protein